MSGDDEHWDEWEHAEAEANERRRLEAEIERLREANRELKDERSRLLNELRGIQNDVTRAVQRALNG